MLMWDITKLLVVLCAAIGFCNGLGWFDTHYFADVDDPHTKYTITDIEEDIQPDAPGITDYLEVGITLLLSSLWVGLNIIVGVICLFPILIYTFHIPIALAALLQVLIYMEYIAGWIQFRTGRNLNG